MSGHPITELEIDSTGSALNHPSASVAFSLSYGITGNARLSVESSGSRVTHFTNLSSF
jgi:hypothetical protein